MFENMISRPSNKWVKYERNPIYELQNIKLIKIEDVSPEIRYNSKRYSEFIDPDFTGKLAVIYEKDNIGRSGGNAQWCYVYDCKDGKIVKYKGTAIHKCVDMDYVEQNYNEVLYSILGKMLFDEDKVRVPNIDLVKNEDYPENKPAILSYNITKREEKSNKDIEEMYIMETIAFNRMERQNIHDHRIPIDVILDSLKVQIMKKVGYMKKKSKEKIDDVIINMKLNDKDSSILQDKQNILETIKLEIDNIDEKTELKDVLKRISEKCGRDISLEEISELSNNQFDFKEEFNGIKNTIKEKKDNYNEIEKSIIQVTVVDLMTNNIDRHLRNWAIIRNKNTDRYVLGLFDHATSFFNMGLREDNFTVPQKHLKENWAPSGVLVRSNYNKNKFSDIGINVFKYLMENYREYTVEMLEKLYKTISKFKKAIDYKTIPSSDYSLLPEDKKKNYYHSDLEMPILTDKIMKGFDMKFSRIKSDYGISFDEEERDYN